MVGVAAADGERHRRDVDRAPAGAVDHVEARVTAIASPAPRHEAPAEQRQGDRDHAVADLDRDVDRPGAAQEERRQREQDERQECATLRHRDGGGAGLRRGATVA